MATCSNCGFEFSAGVNFCPSCGTQVLAGESRPISLVGRTLNQKYRILAEVGAGTMGTVYRAEHTRLQKPVAVKVLHPRMQVNDEFLLRLQREGIVAGKFSHPSAIQIFDFEKSEDGLYYLAMEFVDGVTLREYLQQRKRLDVAEAVLLLRRVLEALEEAHSQGVVHRDLKPENIMVVERAGGERAVKVLDFGLSKLCDLPRQSWATQVGQIIGTPLYMAPEQCAGKVTDHRSDLYAVGLMLFELIAGEPPIRGENVTEILYRHSTQPVPRLVDVAPDVAVPEDLERILQKALEKNPDQRYASAAEMRRDLLSMGLETLARPSGKKTVLLWPPGQGPARSGRSWTHRVGVLVGVLLAAVALIYVLRAGGGDGGAGEVRRVRQIAADERTSQQQDYLEHLDRARSHLRAGEKDGALREVGAAIVLPCRDAEAYLVRAQVFRDQGDLNTAAVDLEEALLRDPGDADAAAEKGWILLDQGRAGPALDCFRKVLGDAPECVSAQGGVGVALYGLQRPVEAEKALQKAVLHENVPASARCHYGELLLDQDKVEEAREQFIAAKRSSSRYWRAYQGLGRVHEADNRLQDAEVEYREAIRLAPNEMRPRVALAALLLDRGQLKDARNVINAGLVKEAGNPELRLLSGVCFEAQGQRADACREWLRSIEENPLVLQTRLLLGMAYEEAGEIEGALQQYQDAAQIDTAAPLPLVRQGICRIRQEEFPDAVEVLERALELDAEQSVAHHALGLLYMNFVGDLERARFHFGRYQELDGSDPGVEIWLEELAAR